MTKSEVLEQLCAICSQIGEEVYNDVEPTDCFCIKKSAEDPNYQFSEKVLSFIRQAVEEKMNKRMVGVEEDYRGE